MSRRKNDLFAQAVVGFFMVVVTALLVYFTIVISGVDIVFGKAKARVTVVFDSVGGLKDHDSVMYRGTKVGTVDRVEVTPSNLVVKINVDGNVSMREHYRIAVCHLSMLGGNYLLLEEGSGAKLDLATTVFQGETPTDWMQDVSRIAKSVNAFMSQSELRTIVTNINAVSARAREIADKTDRIVSRIEQGEGMVGKLLSTDAKLYTDIEDTVANVKDVTDKVKRGEGLAGKLLAKDDHTYQDLKEGIAAFRKACESCDLGNTKENVRELVLKCDKLVANLTAVSENLKNGKGTIGRLANEDSMYDEVEGLIKDCRQIIDNYRDTTPIATFSSLISGAL